MSQPLDYTFSVAGRLETELFKLLAKENMFLVDEEAA